MTSRLIATVTISALIVFTLSACGGQNNARDYQAEPAPIQSHSGLMEAQSFSKAASDQPAPSSPGSSAQNPSTQSFLAYSYNYGFSLPVKAVAEAAQSHADMCLKAGPEKCQVLSSNTSQGNDDYVSAYLRIRAEPKWLENFTAQVQSSVTEAKGEMTNSGVTAEDLTRSILDTDARLKAQTTLRTRLEGLLETRDAKLPDLLALERELARVQGDIESATTTLNVLKKRVSMSVVDINYQTKQVAVSRGALSPIGAALKRFMGDFAEGLASVIAFFAAILPWLLFIILPGLWLVRRFWRGRKAKQKSA